MPHVTITHAGFDADFQAVCAQVFDALANHDAIPQPDSLKIRSQSCTAHLIGTEPQSFAHADLGLLPGRTDPVKTELAQLILTQMRALLPHVGSLTVDVYELSPSYAKDLL